MRTGTYGSITGGQHSFAQVPRADIPRSQFDRSCGLKTTLNAGYLVPIFVDEALPGDTFNLKATLFGRTATQLRPLMDNLYLETFFFAVPIRLIWDNWQRMNGEQLNPGDSTDFLVPVMTENVAELSLSDYLGIPTGIAGMTFSSLWHRAYNLIWREWFRSEDLQDSPVVDTDDGPDDPADYVLLRRGKRHDYFTSCLPWPQKGQPVSLPLGETAPVVPAALSDIPVFGFGVPEVNAFSLGSEASGFGARWSGTHGSATDAHWSYTALEADLTAATAATINDLRQAFQIQRLMERDARGGSRYTEILRSHFGVVSPDQRLQRPEYLGGGSSRINSNPVAQTITGASPTGQLGAFGTMSQDSGFVKSFVEHCVVLGFANIRAELTYQQGLHRMFSRRTRFDFYWPALAHLGEQAVLNKEIYAQGTPDDDLVFGYQERFAEYRYKPSITTGRMRSQSATTVDVWHQGLEFSALPLLNDVFIEDDPPIARMVAVVTEPHFLLDAYFKFKCARPMPTFSVPGLIDHF